MSCMSAIKYLAALTYLVAACYGASLRTFPLTNQQVLDDQGNFILRWGFLEGTGDIEIEMQANCTGWLGIVITAPDLSSGDSIMGGYDDVTGTGYIQLIGETMQNVQVEFQRLDAIIVGDTEFSVMNQENEDRFVNASDPVNGGTFDESFDLALKGAVYHQPWTVVRFSRSIFTGDVKDIAIVPGPMAVGWAYAESDDTDVDHPNDSRGVAIVTFVPAH